MSFCTSCGNELESSASFCKSCGVKNPDSLAQQSSGTGQQMSPVSQQQDTFDPSNYSALPDETFNKNIALRVAIIPILIAIPLLAIMIPLIISSEEGSSGENILSLSLLIGFLTALALLIVTSITGLTNGKSFVRKTKYFRISTSTQFSDLSNLEIKGYKLKDVSDERIVFKPSIFYQLVGGFVYGSNVHMVIKKEDNEGIISYYGVDDASNFLSFRPALFKVVLGRFTEALAKVTEFTVLRTD